MTFDPEGSGYDEEIGNKLKEKWPLIIPKPKEYQGDYVTQEDAYEAWVWHPEANDYKRHGGSLDPRTGMVLKGRKHSTYYLTEEAEKKLGNKIIKKGDRYYSIKGAQGERAMARSFTNREDLAGQLVEPGSSDVWEFAPNADKWVGPDVSKVGSYAFVNDKPMLIGDQQTPFPKAKDDLDPATAPTQPIETLERNIPMDRNKFQESLMQQFGGEDPTRLNISGKATNVVIGSLQKLWGHVFQGKVPWGGRLTEDQAKFWNKEKSSYYANVYNKILEQNKLDRETMKSALDRFDDEAKRIEEAKYKETPEEQEARTRRTETFKAGLMETPEEKRKAEFEYSKKLAEHRAGLDTKGEVTWTTATNNLSKRFGKQDAIGNIIITPELQNRHRLSQKKLVELKNQGVEPLQAINEAENYANKVEENYKLYLDAAKSDKDKKKIRNAFNVQYGYVPR